ncbi:MAG: hypothetical protein FWC39_02110 [Bacteroidetes bacterium]|nr:hypothetical protein [Bacteroidota bacterium]
MKSTNSNTKRLLRNAAIACACICFPAALQANTTLLDLRNAEEKAALAAENETVAQGLEADTYKYEADMGKKQKQQQKRRRHRKITHVR